MTFEELGLSDETFRAVTEAGYKTATPIQQKAIPYVLMGKDLLGTAQTGTGKTAAFLLPMIDVMAQGRSKPRMPRALVLEPTRELAAQVADSFDVYAVHHKLSRALLIGGLGMKEQEAELEGACDIIIATPGRLLDLFGRGQILLSGIQFFVIDEADRMMDMGFMPDVERIVSLLPRGRQTLFFSATMPTAIRKLADKFLNDPKEVSVAPPTSPAETVEQHLCLVADTDKREALRRLIESENVRNALIFCNRKSDVKILHKSLQKHGFDAVALHGDMDQVDRMATLEKFKTNQARLMVCSDVAARGIDIQGLSHVFNFDVPFHADDYIHRIGRTGRAGLRGKAFMLATPKETKSLDAIERLIKNKIPRFDVEGLDEPDMDDVSGGGRRGRSPRNTGRARGPAEEPARPKAPSRRPERRQPAVEARAVEEQAVEERTVEERADEEERVEADEVYGGSSNGGSVPSGDRQRSTAPRRDRDRGRGEKGDTPVGLGDHVPAFLLRPLRSASSAAN